jgi:hypothetical protein
MHLIGHLIQSHNPHGYCICADFDNFMSDLATSKHPLIAKNFVPDIHKGDHPSALDEGVGGHFQAEVGAMIGTYPSRTLDTQLEHSEKIPENKKKS